jgi:hypothetical protein
MYISRWGGGAEIFRKRPVTALGPTLPPTQWVPALSLGESGRNVALTTSPILRRG